MRALLQASLVFVCWSATLIAQRGAGELRLSVTDVSGAALPAHGSLTSRATHVVRTFDTTPEGRITLEALPFGPYLLELTREGFAPLSELIEIRSALPVSRQVVLAVTPVESTIVVTETDTLLNPQRTGSENDLGPGTLRDRQSAAPGRSLIDLVNTQPGWLLEANGVLHPRGSEYQVQYVIDGLPLFDNRSPAFAQSLGVEEFDSMRILTGGYPAEYGRKLGGVVEMTTERVTRAGAHGKVVLQGGSFDTEAGYAAAQYHWVKTTLGVSAEGSRTDRYFDPPVEENYTNHGSASGFSARFERDWRDQDRSRIYVQRRHAGFLVPNERLQESAGQRQDRSAEETLGQLSHEHVFSPRLLGTLQGRVRDTAADLWSNLQSTPIRPQQQRGFREAYANATLSAHRGSHEVKAGGEFLFTSIHEQFGYDILAYRLGAMRVFDRNIPPVFRFADRAQSREQSAFVQDLVHWNRLTLSAGIRFDHYHLRTGEHALSPRLGIAYQFPGAGLVLRASYDRAFQTPAIENLLLASSDIVEQLGGEGVFLPLRPSRGNFYEAGFSKSIAAHVRLDGTYFRRELKNFADDSVLFNTGISFPTAFASASIYGYELKLEVPRWGPFSGFTSYSNMIGRGQLPISGGLFLGDEAAALVSAHGTFPITQDQRNSVRARIRASVGPRVWVAVGGRYNSGLPVELEGSDGDPAFLAEQYGERIVARVNFERGRIRPSGALDASAGVELRRTEKLKLSLQADVINLTDRLNVINFASLFSGTAIEPGRNVAFRLQTEF